MRAIYESLEREGELQRQLRRTKETLVSVALRLQVAIKVSQEDELTISSLVAVAEEAKAKEILATKRAEEAMEMINALTLEVNRLKRRVRAVESEKQQLNPTGLLSSEQQQQMNEYADDEVEEMFEHELRTSVPRDISEKVLKAATPFDRWKMNQFLFAPDTPAASLTHDRDAVDMLVQATQEDLHYAPGYDPMMTLTRPTKSAIAKRRKAKETKSYVHNEFLREQGQMLGANDYEILNNSIETLSGMVNELNLNVVSPTRPGSIDKDDRRFFLNSSAEQMWGNSGNNNNGSGKLGSSQSKKHTNVKLKSLRLDSAGSSGGPGPSGGLASSISSKNNKAGAAFPTNSSQKLQKLSI